MKKGVKKKKIKIDGKMVAHSQLCKTKDETLKA